MPETAARGCSREDPASRLELARGLLRGLEDRASGMRPVVAPEADGRVLPVAAPLAELLPAGGLRRGSTLALPAGPAGAAATSLLFALLAEASAAGAWAGVVGRPALGLLAAAEAGVALQRLALVPHPGKDLLAVLVALLDGMDVVVVSDAARAGIRAGDRQRLAARARQRGAVLVSLGPWPGADAELSCAEPRWHGLGAGSGRLRSRRIGLQLRGRHFAGVRSAEVLLPAVGGGLGAVPARPVEVVPVREAG